jgi:hypothetical protein
MMVTSHHVVLRLPEELEDAMRSKLRDGGMEGVQVTSRAWMDGIREWQQHLHVSIQDSKPRL